MARYKTVKKDSEINIPGVRVEVDRQDGGVRAITIFDCGYGTLLRVASQSGYTNLDLMIPEPPKMVEKFHVTGTVLGLAFEEDYDTEYQAKDRIADVISHDGTAVFSKVEVPEEE